MADFSHPLKNTGVYWIEINPLILILFTKKLEDPGTFFDFGIPTQNWIYYESWIMKSPQKCELDPVSGVSRTAMHGQSALSVPTVCGKQPAEKNEAKSVIKQFPEELNRIMLCPYLCLVFLFESHSFIFRQCGFVNFCFMTRVAILGSQLLRIRILEQMMCLGLGIYVQKCPATRLLLFKSRDILTGLNCRSSWCTSYVHLFIICSTDIDIYHIYIYIIYIFIFIYAYTYTSNGRYLAKPELHKFWGSRVTSCPKPAEANIQRLCFLRGYPISKIGVILLLVQKYG